MSAYEVFLFVGATTLVAAIVTLFLLQTTAARLERKAKRSSRTLEGPVPGHRSLSTIGLNTESARMAPRPPRATTRQSATHMGPPKDILAEMALSTSSILPASSLAEEDRLNSLQTIRARSEALHNDIESDQSAGPGSQTAPGTLPVQRTSKRPVSDVDQEQGTVVPRAKSRADRAEDAASTPPSSAAAAQRSEPAVAPKTTAAKRGKRASATPERTGTSRRGPYQASSDALTDSPTLDLLDGLQASDVGGSLGQDSVLPDIFAGLNDAEVGDQGLADDLTDIDGGGLPTSVTKTPHKSRR